MGVRGLETFMEKETNACPRVNVREIIRKNRKDHQHTPVIVVDGMSVMRYIYKMNNLSWLLGGQIKEYEESLKEFIQNFLNEGAELVFFFDGPCVSSKEETWIKRRMDKLQKVYEILDGLSRGESMWNYEGGNQMILPANLKACTVFVAKKYGCKVFTSIRECDLEISEYAIQHKCIAILAQDTDFVIFYAAKYYLSMKNYNFSQMTTLNYDSNRLASYFGISTQHLPLFATLLGNDVISSEELKDFHFRMLRRRGKERGKWIHFPTLFFEVAQVVKGFPSGYTIPKGLLESIAHKVFSDASKASLIEESINSYNIAAPQNQDPGPPTSSDENWNAVLRKVHDLHKETIVSSVLYGVIVLQQYNCATCVEDYRLKDLPASQTVLKPLRERLYGVLLHEKPGTDGICEVKEMVMCGENSLDKSVFVKAVKPNVHHPGLIALWSGSAMDDSWRLIGDIYGIDCNKIKSLPAHLIVPALTIRYLNANISLEHWELRGLISSVVLVQLYNAQYLSRTEVNRTFQNTRPIRLYTLISRSYSTTQFIFGSLGYPVPNEMTQASNYQDGKLFHLKYKEAQIINDDFQLCDRKEVSRGYFNQLMEFVQEGKT